MDTFPGKDGRIRTVRVQTKKGMINRPVQKLHLLEEKKDKILNGRCAPPLTANVQKMGEPRKCRSGETPSQLPEVNDCSSLTGEDEEFCICRLKSRQIQDAVRACRPTSQETIENFYYMRVGVGVSFC